MYDSKLDFAKRAESMYANFLVYLTSLTKGEIKTMVLINCKANGTQSKAERATQLLIELRNSFLTEKANEMED